MDDLKARLAYEAIDNAGWGDSELLEEAAAHIATLEAQLAARDAEIAAWLRAQYNGRLQSPVYMEDAIERGDYAKGQTDAQQGD